MKTYPVFLNGELLVTANTIAVTNPATGEAFAKMSTVDRAAVARSLQHAHTAFLQWRQQPGKTRGEWLQKIALEVERRRDKIARLMTLENGKPLAQSQAETAMTLHPPRLFGGGAPRSYGRVIPNQVEGKRHLVLKSPIGVVCAISPWNFPLVLAVRKVAPAVAAGCAVVLKPARQTPLCSAVVAECVDTVKLPKGVFQLVAGSASEIGEEFLQNPLCRKITFTGSTEVGKLLIRGAAEQVKPLSLELGGLAPVLVFEDADLDRAVQGTIIAKFRNTGQSCIAANRIYVQRPIYERFLEALVAKTRALKIGDGLEEGVEIGPLIDQEALDKALGHIKDAIGRGARLLCGGRAVAGRKGYFLEPAVLADVPAQAECMREETFAPIAPVCPFETEAEAVEQANASNFGLSSYVFTRDLNRAFRLMDSVEAGMMGINDGVPTTSQAPFGGVKQSGWGRELGAEGMEAFLETKHVSLAIA